MYYQLYDFTRKRYYGGPLVKDQFKFVKWSCFKRDALKFDKRESAEAELIKYDAIHGDGATEYRILEVNSYRRKKEKADAVG